MQFFFILDSESASIESVSESDSRFNFYCIFDFKNDINLPNKVKLLVKQCYSGSFR
jgi:hypothetical protein